MEYGFWLSKRGVFHTLRECRHHGLEEFIFSLVRGNLNWICLECVKQRRRGNRTSKIPGSSHFVGMEIAEKVLGKAFSIMKKVNSKESYDFVCGKGLKVDSKCATLSKSHGKEGQKWAFHIFRNQIPDIFCLIALNNTPEDVVKDPKPIHVWLIPSDAIIDGRPLNDRVCFTVTPRTIARLEPWRRADMEGKIIKCCNHLKEGNEA